MNKDSMNSLSNELDKIFRDHIESKRGPKISLSDFLIPILELYRRETEIEDIYLKDFFSKNILSSDTYYSIVEQLENLPKHSIKEFLAEVGPNFNANGNSVWCEPELARVICQAGVERDKFPHRPKEIIFPSHILLASLGVNSSIRKIFADQGITYQHLAASYTDHHEILDKLDSFMSGLKGSNYPFPRSLSKEETPEEEDDDEEEEFNAAEIASNILENIGFPGPSKSKDGKSNKKSKTPMLDKYAKDITESAKNLDPVLGRENELQQLYEILGCKKKNNAILIGEAGVGKTSLIDLLAQKINSHECPSKFWSKRLFSLDLNSLVAGTKYRGQYEERLKGIIEEVTSNPDFIVFIDEIHNLIGNGGSEGSGDAANILKPHLARGTFQCIGSTTHKEYRKYFEKDSALKRRFQNIVVNEPSKEETLDILKGLKKTYEIYHGVSYSKEILSLCVSLTDRYITDRQFPDKAIDALDLSGSLAKLRYSSMHDEEELELTRTIEELVEEKVNAVASGDFETGNLTRHKELELREELDRRKQSRKAQKIIVTDADVKEAIGKRAGVPIDKLGTSELDKLRTLYKILNSNVIGQDAAVKEVVMALQRNSLGLRDPKRPIASLLFVGPTGSGKTYLCKTLAKEFYGKEDALITLNMSEYGEKGTISKLLGASASYVGYSEDCAFTEVQKKPYSVVLFDEIEKAAPEVFQTLLSILDEGNVTLSNGTKVDFKNTVIVFTGNIGTRDLELHGKGLGYNQQTQDGNISEDKKNSIVQKAIEKTFSPEFRNRITKTVIFNNLTREVMENICNLEIKKLAARLKDKKITLKVSKELKSKIVEACDLKFGARDLQRNVTKFVEVELCQELLVTDKEIGTKRITASMTFNDNKVITTLTEK